MAGNSFGTLFKITSFGESHGKALGVVVDGCPAGLEICEEDIQKELNRRRPGQSYLSSPRKEQDRVEILSGIFEGKTLGTPIAMLVFNKDARSEDYEALKNIHRPGHADFTYEAKYGHRDWRGGGRASARETLARVAAGAIAKKLLKQKGIELTAYVAEIGGIGIEMVDESIIETNALRCPDVDAAKKMQAAIEAARQEGDSLGGVIELVAKGVPAGLGEPVFDKLSAELAKALMSIPAARGFELGRGFDEARLPGSQNNHEGGVMGGISNGEPIRVRLALKAPSSITKGRENPVHGRHDPCVCPRAVPIVEAMVALVLVDHYLRMNTGF